RDARGAHEGGAPAAVDRRPLCGRGGVGDRPGRELQADGASGLSHGAAPPPLRALGLGGAEDRRALLDRLVRAGAAGADHPQAAMTMSAKRGRACGRPPTECGGLADPATTVIGSAEPERTWGWPPTECSGLADPATTVIESAEPEGAHLGAGHPPTAPASRTSDGMGRDRRDGAGSCLGAGHPPTAPASRTSDGM